MTESNGRAEIERRLIERSLQDEDFRRRLLTDPRATLEQELGTPLPEGITIQAVEETADTIYLVLPGRSVDDRVGELSDLDLETVAGGGWTDSDCASGDTNQAHTCTCGCTPP